VTSMTAVLALVVAVGVLGGLWSLVGYGRSYRQIGQTFVPPPEGRRGPRRAVRRSRQLRAIDAAMADQSAGRDPQPPPTCETRRAAGRRP
jgi:hypothetical protein